MSTPSETKFKEQGADDIYIIGKWIVQLQASLALVRDTPSAQTIPEKDSYDRTPFQHPALEGLESLTDDARSHVVSKKQLAQLGQKYGLQDVVRWEPKNVSNLCWPLFLLF